MKFNCSQQKRLFKITNSNFLSRDLTPTFCRQRVQNYCIDKVVGRRWQEVPVSHVCARAVERAFHIIPMNLTGY